MNPLFMLGVLLGTLLIALNTTILRDVHIQVPLMTLRVGATRIHHFPVGLVLGVFGFFLRKIHRVGNFLFGLGLVLALDDIGDFIR